MQVEALRLFVEVMRRGSFAAVAREHRISPSSVSRAIAGLEDELGVRLFQRSTRRLAATEAGEAYYARVEGVIRELEDAREVAVDAGREPRGILRVTAPLTFAQLHLVPLLPVLAERHPELGVELVLDNRLVDLIEERIDVAVRLGRLADSGLIATRLAPMRYACVASPGYLDHRGHPAHPAELASHECLRYPVPGYPARWHFRDTAGGEVSIEVGGRFTISNGLALRDCAIAGMGVTMLPRWNMREALASGALVEVLPGYTCTASRFDTAAWLVTPSRSYVPAKVRAFTALLRESLRP